jgi:hypothetical protein
MNAVEQALEACARKEISNTAVVRAMAESREWFAPMLFAADKLHLRVADHTVIVSSEFPPNPRTLVLFTSRDAVDYAAGRPLGGFSGFLSGVDIFEALNDAEFDKVDVNPGSPRELTFFMESGSFGLLQLVAQVVRLEQALAAAIDTTIPFAQLRDHSGYLIAVTAAGNQPATTAVNGLDGPCAMVFTSPDRFDLYCQRLTAEQRAAIATVTLPGASLFAQLQNFAVKGIVLNPFCPGTVVLPEFLFTRIVAGG